MNKYSYINICGKILTWELLFLPFTALLFLPCNCCMVILKFLYTRMLNKEVDVRARRYYAMVLPPVPYRRQLRLCACSVIRRHCQLSACQLAVRKCGTVATLNQTPCHWHYLSTVICKWKRGVGVLSFLLLTVCTTWPSYFSCLL